MLRNALGALRGFVLLRQRLHDLARVFKLAKVVLEHGVLLIVVEEGFAAHKLVVLSETAQEQVSNAVATGRRSEAGVRKDLEENSPGVVGEHESADPVCCLDVGGLS